MIVVGLLIAAGAASVSALLIVDNSSAPAATVFTPHVLGHALPQSTPVNAFCAGMAVALVFCLGVWMIADGAIARHRRRSDDPADEFLPGEWINR